VPSSVTLGEAMNNIISNFTTLDGRIGRQSWWIGTIIIIVVFFILSLFLLPLIGFGISPGDIAAAGSDPAALSQVITSGMGRAAWGSLVLYLLAAYPSYALGVKRRHDKDNNGLDLLIYMALGAVVLILQALGMTTVVTEVAGMVVPQPNTIGWVLSIVQLVYGIYMLVVLGFLKGTKGPNQYGPDPLGGPAA
jgi:uncharacterized membrane protein YhaH (DUF805 family)